MYGRDHAKEATRVIGRKYVVCRGKRARLAVLRISARDRSPYVSANCGFVRRAPLALSRLREYFLFQKEGPQGNSFEGESKGEP